MEGQDGNNLNLQFRRSMREREKESPPQLPGFRGLKGGATLISG